MDFLDVSVEDEAFVQTKDDVKIARYMSEEKFIKNLESESIWFSNTKQFEDKAFEIYKEHAGNIDLVEIASQLNISPGTIRGWKSKSNGQKIRNSDLWKLLEEKFKPHAVRFRVESMLPYTKSPPI